MAIILPYLQGEIPIFPCWILVKRIWCYKGTFVCKFNFLITSRLIYIGIHLCSWSDRYCSRLLVSVHLLRTLPLFSSGDYHGNATLWVFTENYITGVTYKAGNAHLVVPKRSLMCICIFWCWLICIFFWICHLLTIFLLPLADCSVWCVMGAACSYRPVSW